MKNVLTLMLHYFPYVLQGVLAVEQSIGSQPGAAKKQVVLGSVLAAAKVAGTVDESHVDAVAALIDTTVSSLNNAGVFGKQVAAAAA